MLAGQFHQQPPLSGHAWAPQSVLDLVARRLTVSSEAFQGFLDRHSRIDCLVPEDNKKMKDTRSKLSMSQRMCPHVRLPFGGLLPHSG